MKYPKLYSRTGAFQGVLENAKIAYTLKDTPLSTAKATLATDDPANALLTPYSLAELYDGEQRIDLFRVIAMPESAIRAQKGQTTHSLEHVLATLMDDILPGYHEIGGTGMEMGACIQYILDRQTVKRWRLGTCAFDTQFQYAFSNDYLLKALLSLPKQLDEPYLWTTDTSTTPWTLNLLRPGAAAECELRYRQNMTEIVKSYDAAELCTRVYPFGYGEGINQLTIKEVNGGRLYIDADTQAVWGVVAKPFADTAMEQPQALYNRAKAWLEQQKNPRISYKIKGADLYRLTGEPWYRFMPGRLCRINDQEHGVLVEARVTQVSKADVYGKPGDVTVTIANAPANAAGEIADLAARASINELYAQGATNMYAEHFADNASPDKPCRFRFPVDSDCVRINRVVLKYDLEAFRAYERAAEAGGSAATTSGSDGGGTRTSEAAGEAEVTTPVTTFAEQVVITGAIDSYGDAKANTDGNALGLETDAATGRTGASGDIATQSSGSLTTGTGNGNTGESDDTSHSHSSPYHNHGTNPGMNVRVTVNSATCSHAHPAGSHTHNISGHTHTVPSHSHTLNSHRHSISQHQHGMAHTHGASVRVTIPALTVHVPSHRHTVSIPTHTHSLNLPSHTHGLTYGIFEGSTASAVTIRVDGSPVPASAVQGGEVDLVPYMSKDERGKITRGTWHEVEITPDTDTRIVADIYVKVFIRSQGGGDY